MAIVKWNRYFPSVWPSFFDEENWPTVGKDWPDLSSNSGLDIYETDDSVVVKAAVPGIKDKDVEVTVEGSVLTVNGSTEETEEQKKQKKIIYKSSRQTSFSYSTSLPRMVDGTRAKAEVEDGIVTITIPKVEEEKPKRIEVKRKQ